MTFMPASSPCASVVPFVINSIEQDKPMIVVFVNYRLNIFAFGDGKGVKNLALKDQRLAIEWVSKHIESFGGDAVSAGVRLCVSVHFQLNRLTEQYNTRRGKCRCCLRTCTFADWSSCRKGYSAVWISALVATASRSPWVGFVSKP